MARDTPFVGLPTPPASAHQPAGDADVRGYDYGDGTTVDDEYLRATAYARSIQQRVTTRLKFLEALKGNDLAWKTLLRKTLPLADSSPPHYEGP